MTIKVTYNVTDVYVTQDVSPVYINVSYSGVGSGGAAVWGGITGTLSDQTDLQTALDGKFDDPTGTTSQYLRGDGSLATFPAIPSGTVQSVGLTMPSAFSVANSPITTSGTLAVTGAGTASQYVRGDGQLANFPTNGGGGSSVNYYLNGSVNQGTFGGDTYYEMSKTPILGAGTNFTRTNGQGNGYIASFITDAGDPSLLNIPGGNWNLEFYFNASSGGGNPSFYTELYKVSSANVFTLIASGSTNPEGITQGTVVDQYFTSIPVPQTSLLATDRIAVRIFVTPSGRTITLHTEDGNLCEVLTTLSTGLNALNGLTSQVQYFATGTSGTDFGISSATDTHTFNLPTASSINRGALSSADWTTFNNKVPASRTLTINGVAFDLSADRSWTVAGGISGSGASGQVAYWTGTSAQAGSNNLFWDAANSRLGIGTNAPQGPFHINADITALNNGLLVTRTSVTLTNANFQISNGTNNTGEFLPGFLFTSNFLFAGVGSTIGGFFGARITNAHPQDIGIVFEARTKSSTALSQGYIASFRSFATDYVRIAHNGNMLLQNGGTFTDTGERLQVTGNAKIVGSGATSGTTALTVQNSSSSNLFTVRNDGLTTLTGSLQLDAIANFGGVGFYPSNNGGYAFGGGARALRYETVWGSFVSSPSAFAYNLFNSELGTNANISHTSMFGNFAPTSGTKVFQYLNITGTINQTGGANGITRGLYVNPTLTSAADFRAIETTNGKVIFGNLPTSSAGLPTGAIWNDAGTIKIV
jgi:hypothetical protein